MELSVYANCGATERVPRTPNLLFPGILSDPLVRLMMKADGVDPKALERELWEIAASLPSPGKRHPFPFCLPRAP